jgi:hypothetical protein
MLTAVQSFITDSFANGTEEEKDDWGLNQLKLGRHEILLERGNSIYIAVIYKGRPGSRLKKLLLEYIEKIENKYGKVLNKWGGNFTEIKGIEKVVEPIISYPDDVKIRDYKQK